MSQATIKISDHITARGDITDPAPGLPAGKISIRVDNRTLSGVPITLNSRAGQQPAA